VTGVSYGIEIHAIAKDQYPRYRSPNGAEAFDKGRILGRYQSGMDQIKGTARAKLGLSCLQCKRVVSTWSRTSRVEVARGRGFVSSYLVAKGQFVFVVVRFRCRLFRCRRRRISSLVISLLIALDVSARGGSAAGTQGCARRCIRAVPFRFICVCCISDRVRGASRSPERCACSCGRRSAWPRTQSC
jgi:hypothetical protein